MRRREGAAEADAADIALILVSSTSPRSSAPDPRDPSRRKARGAIRDDRAIRRLEGIINAMTPAERAKPEILKASRKRRIAAGAGASVQEVNRLLAQFEQTQKMMKMVSKGGIQKMMRGLKGAFPGLR